MKICIISLTRISQKKKVFRNVLVRNEVQIYNLDQCVCIYVYTYICIYFKFVLFQKQNVEKKRNPATILYFLTYAENNRIQNNTYRFIGPQW